LERLLSTKIECGAGRDAIFRLDEDEVRLDERGVRLR